MPAHHRHRHVDQDRQRHVDSHRLEHVCGHRQISAGTLQLGDGVANNGYLAANINLSNAALSFANPAAETYAGA